MMNFSLTYVVYHTKPAILLCCTTFVLHDKAWTRKTIAYIFIKRIGGLKDSIKMNGVPFYVEELYH